MKKLLCNKTKAITVISLVLMSVFAFLVLTAPVHAIELGLNYGSVTGLGNNDPITITTQIIKLVLGLLGLIAVIIILIGGFKWMTAAGNEDKVGEAKKTITQGIIGLVIVLAAWGIASWVIGTAFNLTNE